MKALKLKLTTRIPRPGIEHRPNFVSTRKMLKAAVGGQQWDLAQILLDKIHLKEAGHSTIIREKSIHSQCNKLFDSFVKYAKTAPCNCGGKEHAPNCATIMSGSLASIVASWQEKNGFTKSQPVELHTDIQTPICEAAKIRAGFIVVSHGVGDYVPLATAEALERLTVSLSEKNTACHEMLEYVSTLTTGTAKCNCAKDPHDEECNVTLATMVSKLVKSMNHN